jgi:biotin carboxyl carrier protein
MEFLYRIGGRDVRVTIEHRGDQTIVQADNDTFVFDRVEVDDRWITTVADGATTRVPFARSRAHVHVGLEGNAFEIAPAAEEDDDDESAGGFTPEVSSPMPGRVLQVLVAEGDEVSAGDPLVLLEAMKMEQTVRTVGDAKVVEVRANVDEMVGPGQTLVVLDASPEEPVE